MKKQIKKVTAEIPIWGTIVWIECYGENMEYLQKGLQIIKNDFKKIDETFSPFRLDSEVSKFNRDSTNHPSELFSEIWELCKNAKSLTEGNFDAWCSGKYDPIGIIKGWAADRAVQLLKGFGATSIQVNAAGDISLLGGYPNAKGIMPWKIGIQNPNNPNEIVKVIEIHTGAIATSGTYLKGPHILDPKTGLVAIGALSATVVGPVGALADALATGLVVAGREGAGWFAKPELAEYGAWVVDRHLGTAWSIGKV